MRLLLATVCLGLAGCMTLTTTMVAPDGTEIECSGFGRYIEASMVRDNCVNQAKLQGYKVKK